MSHGYPVFHYIDFEAIGGSNDRRGLIERVAELVVTFDYRPVVHDGYCSGAGDDTGEWEYDITESKHLTQSQYELLQKHCNTSGLVPLDVMKKLHPAEVYDCGYCGYASNYDIKRGYVRPLLQFAYQSITDTATALLPLELPPYCILWILEFLYPYIDHMKKQPIVSILEGLRNSRERIVERRTQATNKGLLSD